MATTLVNMQKRRQLFELKHTTFYRPRWGYRVTLMSVSEHNPKTGEVARREIKKKLPGTLTLLGGARLEGLPDEIAAVPAIRDAVRAGRVRLERSEAKAPAAPAPEASQPKAETRSRRRRNSGGE